MKVGDIVKIRKSSEYYGSSYMNPANTEGVIESIFEYNDHPIRVRFPSIGTNVYRNDDLMVVRRAEVEQ